MSGHHHHGPPSTPSDAAATPPQGVEHKVTSSFQLLATLFIAGAMAGILVVSVYSVTLPAIKKAAAAKLDGAVKEVLRAPARYDTLWLVADKLQREAPAGIDPAEVTKAFVGFDKDGNKTGVAIQAAEPGFQEEVSVMIGFDPASGKLTGYTILDQKETPGLGDKVDKDTTFRFQFRGKVAPLKGVKTPTTDASTVQTITGATISSRAIIRIINNAVALWQPRLQAFEQGGGK